MSNYLVIMAGGVGSRFWPASRENNPKQFLDILGTGKSLIRLTFERFLPIIPAEHIYVVTHIKYKELVLEHLPELGPEQVLGEPSRNNTAPCVAYAAMKIHDRDRQANVVIAPADHIILKENEFRAIIRRALVFTDSHQAIVTLGIKPSRPDTGYGYIEMDTQDHDTGVYKAIRFTEKPQLDQAMEYLKSGNYAWNSGLFIFSTSTIQKAFAQLAAGIYELLGPENINYNSPEEKAQLEKFYPQTPKISIDYAIMEKAENIFTINADIGWSDLGTWKSLYEECDKDDQENVVQASRYILEQTSNSLIRASADKLLVIRGLDDYIVIDQPDVLVIYPKTKEQEIKKIRNQVESEFGDSMI